MKTSHDTNARRRISMFGRLMPKEGRFFDLFNGHAALIVDGAHELNLFMNDMGSREAHDDSPASPDLRHATGSRRDPQAHQQHG
jgi:hypothetical protein